jgi:hypothetical protein
LRNSENSLDILWVRTCAEKTIINPQVGRRAGDIDWWSVSHKIGNTFYFDVLTRLLVNSVWSCSWDAGIKACVRLRLVSNIKILSVGVYIVPHRMSGRMSGGCRRRAVKGTGVL